MNTSGLWPFVLLMPSDVSKRISFLQTLFSSPVAIEVLLLFDKGEELCQKELINVLKHHSNKTVIAILKKLVNLGLLREYQRVERREKKVVKLKCYRLTEVGYWYNVFLKNIEILDKSSLRNLVDNIILLLLERLIIVRERVYRNYWEFTEKVILSLLNSIVKESRRRVEPEVIVFGSIALDVYLDKKPIVFSGGSGANIAFNLSKLGLRTSFITKFSTDVLSLRLGVELVDNGIDISLSQIESGTGTPLCVIDRWATDEPLIRCLYREENPPVLDKLNNDIISTCSKAKAIYLGEGICKVYTELLENIDLKNKFVVYRPSETSLINYFDECKNILQYNPILVLNSRKARLLVEKGVRVPEDLIELGVEKIVITKGSKGATIYIGRNSIDIDTRREVNVIDTVGAGDLFTAILIYNLLKGLEFVDAVKKACSIASKSVAILGPRKFSSLSSNHHIISFIS